MLLHTSLTGSMILFSSQASDTSLPREIVFCLLLGGAAALALRGRPQRADLEMLGAAT
jgi:hypothetical protein